MGNLLGHGVRFGWAGPVMVFGEGLETLLSVREVLPAMPMIAGLSAAHLAAIAFPDGLRRLYVARDNDDAGRLAFERSEEHTSELQSLMRISYAVFCLKKKKTHTPTW